MKLIQYKGPFTAGQEINIPAQQNYKYIQIGLQVPNRQPIAYYPSDKPLDFDFTINGINYRINDKCILEFDDLNELSINISIKRDLPWESVIDIGYEISEE